MQCWKTYYIHLSYRNIKYVTWNDKTNIYFVKLICIYYIYNYKLLYFGLFSDLKQDRLGSRRKLSTNWALHIIHIMCCIAQLVASLRRYLLGLGSYIPEQPTSNFFMVLILQCKWVTHKFLKSIFNVILRIIYVVDINVFHTLA